MESDPQNKPRFRNDLVAQQLEEEGVQYVDVTDPNSGNTFRFYDVEYSIACGMNGERDLSELADWARADLGIETTPDELATVMSTLAELGYLDGGADNGAAAQAAHEPEAPELELGAPGGEPSYAEGTPAPEIELGAPGAAGRGGRGHEDVYSQQTRPVDAIELEPARLASEGVPTPANGAGANASGAVELASEDLEEYQPKVTEMPRPPAGAPPTPPGTDDDMSFAGLMDAEGVPTAKKIDAKAPRPSADHTPTPPPPIEITADAPPEPKRPTTMKFDVDEPTNLPGAVPDDDDEDVSVDLSAHLSLDKRQVEEAVRASKVMMVPEIPADLMKSADSSDSDVDLTKPAMPLPPPPLTSQVPAAMSIEDDQKRVAVESAAAAVALPERPIAAVSSKPIEPSRTPAGATAGKKSGRGGLWATLLVLLVGGAGALWYVTRESATPTAGTEPKPNEVAPPTPPPSVDPGKLAGPSAPAATLSERTGTATEAKASAAGRIAWLATPGSEVAAGDPIAKLQGFQRWEQQKANALARLDFYQSELDKVKAANNAAAVAKNERKVQEKRDLVARAEAELGKLVVLAPAAGKVEPVAKAGVPLAVGAVVAKIVGAGPQLVATFDAADAALEYKADSAACQVAAKGAPDKRSACVVESVEGTRVTVRVVDGSPFKPGDEVELRPSK